jgi:hypothetical protein
MTTTIKKNERRFPLGNIYVTRGVQEGIPMEDILSAICRHANGDWGLVGKEDWEANEQALAHGTRLLSAYKMQTGKRVWVITESDRSATTVLFPEEY